MRMDLFQNILGSQINNNEILITVIILMMTIWISPLCVVRSSSFVGVTVTENNQKFYNFFSSFNVE